MNTTTHVPVLIAGAGPTGLTLACDLARRGVQCRIVDRADRLFTGSRGKGLQPRTLEVFDDLGVIDAVLAYGGPFPAFRLYAGSTVRWTRTLTETLGIEPISPDSGAPTVSPTSGIDTAVAKTSGSGAALCSRGQGRRR